MWPDKAVEERGREGKQTEQEAGAQCGGIPPHRARGLLGKMFMDDSILECSQMRESFNWLEAPSQRWMQIYAPPLLCVLCAGTTLVEPET